VALHVITGPSGSGKTSAAYARLFDAARAGLRCALLVPAAPDVTRVMGDLAGAAPMGVRADTLDGFLDRLWRSLGDGRQVVTAAERLMLLAESVSDTRFNELGASADTPGFLGVIGQLVTWAAASDRPEPPRGRPAGRAGELLRCVEGYEQALARASVIERNEAHRRVALLLARREVPDLTVLDGFAGFTPAQELFVRACASVADVVVCLTNDENVPGTLSAAPLVERLTECGSHQHLPLHPGSVPAELDRIRSSFGGGASDRTAVCGAVVFSEAWGEEAEAARIAAEVREEMDRGTRPGSIAVVFRDPARHFPALLRAFEEADVPADWDVRLPYLRTGLGRAVALMLSPQVVRGRLATVMDLLRTPYSPASDSLLDSVNARARRSGGADWREVERWCSAEPGAAAFLREIRRAVSVVAGEEAEERWHRLVTGMLGRAYPGERPGGLRLLMDGAAARVTLDCVKSLGVSRSGASTVADLERALRATTVTVDTLGHPDRVQVTGADRIRCGTFTCVIVGGMSAGEFPRGLRGDALQAPGIRAALERAGIAVQPEGGIEHERLLFYQAITRASQRLVLSRQSHDDDGNPRQPSIFWEELLDLYRDPSTSAWVAGEPAFRRLGPDGLALHPHVAYTERRARRQAAATRAAGSGPPEPVQLGATARASLASRDVFSASEVETYLQCPYLWYVQRIIRPRDLDARVDVAAEGMFGHEVLQRFYSAFVTETGEPRITADVLDRAHEIHAAAVRLALERMRPASAAETVAVRRMIARTWQVIETDATLLPGFTPIALEWSFGGDDDPEDLGGFALAGRIDRIDADERRLVVIDYKRTDRSSRWSFVNFAEEGLVQLPLYALVASRRLGRSVAGGLYRSIGRDKPRGFIDDALADKALVKNDVVDTAGMTSLIEDALERTSRAVEGMRAGAIDARTPARGCPGYCPARRMCTEWRPGHGRA